MERTFKCPIPNSPPTDVKEYVCGGSMYCINGSCSEIEDEASNEFKDALVAMGAIDQVGKEFDPDTLGLFKGTRETCHKPRPEERRVGKECVSTCRSRWSSSP